MITENKSVSLAHAASTETVVVIGANRGIGLGFVRHYLSQPGYFVIATYRDCQKINDLSLSTTLS